MPDVPGERQGFLAAPLGLVRIAQEPQDAHKLGEAFDLGMQPRGGERGGGPARQRRIQALLQVDTGRDRVAIVERGGSQQQMAFAHQDRIALALRQVEEAAGRMLSAVCNCAWAL